MHELMSALRTMDKDKRQRTKAEHKEKVKQHKKDLAKDELRKKLANKQNKKRIFAILDKNNKNKRK